MQSPLFAFAADHIEALEAEVRTLELSNQLLKDAYESSTEGSTKLTQQLVAAEAEVVDANLIAKEQTQLAISAKLALAEAEARAERLREALEGMVHYSQHAEHWQYDNPQFVEVARKALEDDKPAIRAAAWEEGK